MLYITAYDKELRITKKNRNNVLTINTDDVSNNIKPLLAKAKLSDSKAIICMCNTGILVRVDRVAKVKLKLLDKVIQQNLEDYFPAINIDDYEWRYSIIREIEEDNVKYYEIKVSAIPKECINSIMNLMKQSKIKVKSIVLWPYIAQFNFGNDCLIVDGNSNGVHLMLLKDKNLITYITIPYSITRENTANINELYSEIQGYLEYYKSRNQGEHVKSIDILGELGEIPGFISELKQRINSNIQINSRDNSIYLMNKLLEKYSKGNVEVNFIPNEILASRKELANALKSIIVIFIYAGLINAFVSYLQFHKSNLSDNYNKLNKAYLDIQNKISEYQQKGYANTLEKLKTYEKLKDNKGNISLVITEINKSVPPNVHITGLYFKYVNLSSDKKSKKEIYEQTPNALIIEGEVSNMTDYAGLLVYRLLDTGLFNSVDLKYINKLKDGKSEFIIEATIKEMEK